MQKRTDAAGSTELSTAAGTPDGDALLLEAVASGDEAAFGQLYDAWFDRVFDVALRIVRDQDAAADIAQDALLAAWRKLDELDDARAFGGWVLRISRNRALDHKRKHDRTTPVDDESMAMMETTDTARAPGEGAEARLAAATDPAVAATDAELVALVWDAADALGDRDASLLDLHLRHGLTPAEIAGEMDIEPNAAHQGLHRLRQRLGRAVEARLLWRGGRPTCAELDRVLDDQPTTAFNAETASIVRSHAKDCGACAERQRTHLQPSALFAAIPVAIAPVALKAKAAAAMEAAGAPMLGSEHAAASPGGPASGRGTRRRVATVAAGAVASILIIVAVLAATTSRLDNGESTAEVARPDATTTSASVDTTSTTGAGVAAAVDEPAPAVPDAAEPPQPEPVPAVPAIVSFAISPGTVAQTSDAPTVSWQVDPGTGGSAELTGPNLSTTALAGAQLLCPGTLTDGVCVAAPGSYDYTLHAYDSSGAQTDVRTLTLTVS